MQEIKGKQRKISVVMDMVIVRNKLKFWRHRYDMNQAEFAEYLNIDSGLYVKYETQKAQPDLKTALMIAGRLRVSVEDIFGLVKIK